MPGWVSYAQSWADITVWSLPNLKYAFLFSWRRTSLQSKDGAVVMEHHWWRLVQQLMRNSRNSLQIFRHLRQTAPKRLRRDEWTKRRASSPRCSLSRVPLPNCDVLPVQSAASFYARKCFVIEVANFSDSIPRYASTMRVHRKQFFFIMRSAPTVLASNRITVVFSHSNVRIGPLDWRSHPHFPD